MRTRPREPEWQAASERAAANRATIERQMAEIARGFFWRWQGAPAQLAERLASDLCLRTEELASECQVYDPKLGEIERVRQIALRIYSRLGLAAPEEVTAWTH